MSLIDQVAALCDQAVASLPEPLAGEASSLRQRLDGPLRVAVAGRVKAGKSTLLNALVGERLAPTDAGECTRIITWYEEGTGYDVQAELPDGSRRPVTFQRNGALRVDLEDLRPEQVANLRVSWPSRRLHDMTLIDTPGLASVHGENSARTEDFLTVHDDRAGSADAVVYLLRHVHRHDVESPDHGPQQGRNLVADPEPNGGHATEASDAIDGECIHPLVPRPPRRARRCDHTGVLPVLRHSRRHGQVAHQGEGRSHGACRAGLV